MVKFLLELQNYLLGLFKQTVFFKSDAANDFSGCITPKYDIDQFSQKNFDV